MSTSAGFHKNTSHAATMYTDYQYLPYCPKDKHTVTDKIVFGTQCRFLQKQKKLPYATKKKRKTNATFNLTKKKNATLNLKKKRKKATFNLKKKKSVYFVLFVFFFLLFFYSYFYCVQNKSNTRTSISEILSRQKKSSVTTLPQHVKKQKKKRQSS